MMEYDLLACPHCKQLRIGTAMPITKATKNVARLNNTTAWLESCDACAQLLREMSNSQESEHQDARMKQIAEDTRRYGDS